MTARPVVTVLMAVYDPDPAQLREAAQSILGQTFSDFEFLIVDDGGGPATREALGALAGSDARVRLVRNEANLGLTRALNRGLAAAAGTYVARQDADDVSFPQRLARQVRAFEERPELVLLGANCLDLGADGSRRPWGAWSGPELEGLVFRRNPFPHSSVMFRRAEVLAAGGYDESYDTTQDFELWMRLAARGARLDMIPEPLLLRRVGGRSITARRKWRQCLNSLRARLAHPGAGLAVAWRESLRQFAVAALPPGLALWLRARRGRPR